MQGDFKRNIISEIAIICYVVSKGKPNYIIMHNCLVSFYNNKMYNLFNVIEKAFHVIHLANYTLPSYKSLQLCTLVC